MKTIIKKIITTLNKLVLSCSHGGIQIKGNTFYLFSIKADKTSKLSVTQSTLEKTKITIVGNDNELNFKTALISDANITITGNHNKIILSEGVKLRKATVIIRGNHCTIRIGQNSSFGQIRMVNVGNNCDITIGKGCLFADNIELWASDTHPIYDDQQRVINPEESVTIKDNVWVGSHVTLLKGITVESGSVIGMGTMVTKNIPEKVISVGNPNRTIKEGISWSLDYKGETHD